VRWAPILLVALSAGLLGLSLLYPVAQHDAAPPTCFATFSYEVPCAAASSAVTATGLAVLVATVAVARRPRRPTRYGKRA
jgi:hypothetical protein